MANEKKPTRKKTAPKTAPKTDPNRPNREERRRQKFHKAGPAARKPGDPWPESRPNPAYGHAGVDEAAAGRPDQDVTRTTGAGAGGATEGAERVVDREGIHGGNSPKG
jgi:hypothetical protein